jgi:hypothetical protein
MIGALCLIGSGALLALYFTHASFRNRVNDLALHVKALFARPGPIPTTPIDPPPAATQVTEVPPT